MAGLRRSFLLSMFFLQERVSPMVGPLPVDATGDSFQVRSSGMPPGQRLLDSSGCHLLPLLCGQQLFLLTVVQGSCSVDRFRSGLLQEQFVCRVGRDIQTGPGFCHLLFRVEALLLTRRYLRAGQLLLLFPQALQTFQT